MPRLWTGVRAEPSLARWAGGAQEIDEQAVRAGDAFGELAEERDAGVDVEAFAVACIDDRTVLLRLAGIVHGEERRVLGIELRPEVEASFLNPTFEIILGDFVWPIQKRIIRLQKFHRRLFVSDPRQRTRR